MHILLFNYEFPPIGGGAGRASAAIAEGLVTLGHEVCVVTAAWQNLSGDEKTAAGLRIIRVPCARKQIHACSPWEMLSYLFWANQRLPQITAAFPADIVLSFFTVPSGWVGERAARRLKRPHVLSLRGMDVPGFDEKNLRLYHRILSPTIARLWRFADLLIANSQALRQKALQFAQGQPISPIKVIGNGITPCPPAKIQANQELRFLAVGRLVGQKGHAALLTALSKPEIFAFPWKLEIVGSGPLQKPLKKQITDLQLQARVTVIDWLDNKDLEDKFQCADFLLHPSEDEGMSNVLLEALAHGLLVITTKVGGNPEIIRDGENGFLSPTPAIADLSETLLKALWLWREQPEKITAIRIQAQKSVQAQTWLEIAKRYAWELSQICGLPTEPPGPKAV